MIAGRLIGGCIPGVLADAAHPDCTVPNVRACGSPTDTGCWRVVVDSRCAAASTQSLRLVVDGSTPETATCNVLTPG